MMRQRIMILFSAALLSWGLLSCQRLSDVRPIDRGALPPQISRVQYTIPADYGDLIAVTTRPDQPNWTQAWFMKTDKSIVVVSMNLTRGEIAEKVVTISRM